MGGRAALRKLSPAAMWRASRMGEWAEAAMARLLLSGERFDMPGNGGTSRALRAVSTVRMRVTLLMPPSSKECICL